MRSAMEIFEKIWRHQKGNILSVACILTRLEYLINLS
jgi:hypothetical protein